MQLLRDKILKGGEADEVTVTPRLWLPSYSLHCRSLRICNSARWTRVQCDAAVDVAQSKIPGLTGSLITCCRTESLKCRALELQLWETLPSFCDWAQDTAEAFR